MKNSLAHIPANKRLELKYITQRIVEVVPQTQMIILYGSYARGNFVEYEENDDFGTPSLFKSDFDILVLTDKANTTIAEHIIGRTKFGNINSPHHTHVQVIVEDIQQVNKHIAARRFFFTDIKKEGIMLYNSGNFKLERRKKLDFKVIKKLAQGYFNEKYSNALGFLDGAGYFYSKNNYRLASFNLHQCAENSFIAARLTYTLYADKNHDLKKWIGVVKNYYPEGYSEVFPFRTDEDKRLFQLLREAYIQSRYNPNFVVTKEDIDALMPILQKLLDLTKKLCETRIEAYDNMI